MAEHRQYGAGDKDRDKETRQKAMAIIQLRGKGSPEHTVVGAVEVGESGQAVDVILKKKRTVFPKCWK